jgi:hypothetical protein
MLVPKFVLIESRTSPSGIDQACEKNNNNDFF